MTEFGRKLINKIWCDYKTDGFYWFRLFGYGLVIKDLTKYEPLFSERNGYKKRLKIKNWSITFLNKN